MKAKERRESYTPFSGDEASRASGIVALSEDPFDETEQEEDAEYHAWDATRTHAWGPSRRARASAIQIITAKVFGRVFSRAFGKIFSWIRVSGGNALHAPYENPTIIFRKTAGPAVCTGTRDRHKECTRIQYTMPRGRNQPEKNTKCKGIPRVVGRKGGHKGWYTTTCSVGK